MLNLGPWFAIRNCLDGRMSKWICRDKEDGTREGLTFALVMQQGSKTLGSPAALVQSKKVKGGLTQIDAESCDLHGKPSGHQNSPSLHTSGRLFQ